MQNGRFDENVKMKNNKIKKKRGPGVIILIAVLVVIIAAVVVYIFLRPININSKGNLCGPVISGPNHNLSYCDRSCESDSDCKYECGCGPLNKNEKCNIDNIIYDCYGLVHVKCVSNKCESAVSDV